MSRVLDLKARWGLQTGVHFLNHGSFGATPLSVLQAQTEIRARMERQPLRFFVRDLAPLLDEALRIAAEFVGAEPQNLAFVDNATTGVNAVLRSLELEEGDRLVTLSHVYPAVRNALRFVADRSGASVHEVRLPCPVLDDAWLRDLEQALVGARLAVLDHVTSASGLVLPIQEMIRLCRKHGVPVLVDGAHGPGLLELDLEALGADWYAGNLHKWVCAPKGTALLWAAPHVQAALHPTVIGHALGQGWQAEFHTLGTRDYSGWLSMDAVGSFWEEIGGLESGRVHNNHLASAGAEILTRGLETQAAGPEEMRAAMAALLLPPSLGQPTKAGALALNDRLWREFQVEVPIIPHEDRLWVRISAQVYNELEDYRALLRALLALQGE